MINFLKILNIILNMYYVYILRSPNCNTFYTGFTANLDKRLFQHNDNQTTSTKNKGPWHIIFYEAYLNKYDALRREKYLKSTKGKTTLKYMLKEYLLSFNLN
jgi:putative endonuclease